MKLLTQLQQTYDAVVLHLNKLEDISLLLIRLYLAPVFIQAGWSKLVNFEDTVSWFGNPEWGLGLPAPEIMVSLAAGAEFIGGWLILFGFMTRLTAIPLTITMAVAALSVHAKNGWLAIADSSSWFADGTILYNESVMAAAEKKQMAVSILQEYGNYDWLSSSGSFTILNNGVEFAVTYLIMTLVLLVYGGGKWTSADGWVRRYLKNKTR